MSSLSATLINKLRNCRTLQKQTTKYRFSTVSVMLLAAMLSVANKKQQTCRLCSNVFSVHVTTVCCVQRWRAVILKTEMNRN